MSRKGENIYKRKDNRWEGRYAKGYGVGGKIMYGYVYAHSYREVKEKLQKAKVNISLGLTNEKKAHRRFGEFVIEWLQISKCKVTESTFVKYTAVVNKYIMPRFGAVRPETITTVDVSNFTLELFESHGLSPKTVRDVLTLLKCILKYARKTLGSAMPEIEAVYPKEEKREMRVLSITEQEMLIRVLMSEMNEYKFGIFLALTTGLRIGELCALKWENVDIHNGCIKVKSTMQRLKDTTQLAYKDFSDCGTKVIISSPKSKGSARTIPLTDNTVKLCRENYRGGADAFVLTGEADRFCEPRKMQYHFHKIMREIGLDDVNFHSLRHTFATRCVEVGFEIKSLSEILGHSSPKITLERYVHSSMQFKKKNMSRLSVVGF